MNDKKKLKRIGNPYTFKETIGWLFRNVKGPSKKNPGNIEYLPKSYQLNNDVNCKYKIAFIGDIMDMKGKSLVIDDSLKNFVNDCDFLIGNFEATITDAKGTFMAQKHVPQIMDALADLFPPEKTYLSVANNHAGDFGEDEFLNSIHLIESRGFTIFGWDKKPYYDINEHLRVIGGTSLSNQDMDYVLMLENAVDYLKDGFNILSSHWGYEIELFPRLETIEIGNKLINVFDMIIGTHSHTPQPVTISPIEHKLIAYSLGDFCIEQRIKHFQYGIILKTDIGFDKENIWQVGAVNWQFTCCKSISKSECLTGIVNSFPYLE